MPENDDWFYKGSEPNDDPVPPRPVTSQTRYTGATLYKSIVLQELTAASYTYSDPATREEGTAKHLLLAEYLKLRKSRSEVEAFATLARGEAAEDPEKTGSQQTLWAKTIRPRTDDLTEVAKAAEKFIAEERYWKNVKTEQHRRTRIIGPSGETAGYLSYRFDAVVKLPLRLGTHLYDFKFANQPFSNEVVDWEIALMELVSRQNKLNNNLLPPNPGSRLIFPEFIQSTDFSGRANEVKHQIITTCLRLLTADFESTDNHLVTVRHRIVNPGWDEKSRKDEPTDYLGFPVRLF